MHQLMDERKHYGTIPTTVTHKIREYRHAVQEVLDCSFTMCKTDYETFSISEVYVFNSPWELD